MKKTLVIALAFLSFAALHAQNTPLPDKEGSLVKWMSLKEALEKTKTQQKPIILDFYTDWCGWCKKMMTTTYANPNLASYINENFYPVKFNAEGKDTIEYLGKTYMPVSGAPRATHPLATMLLQNKLMYPTTLFLNAYNKDKNEFGFSMIAQGYLEVKKIEPLLVFQLENAFRNSSYEDFEVQYNRSFYDSAVYKKLEAVKWQKPVDFFGKTDSSAKKTLVFIHTEWCNSCRVMNRTSFTDELTEKYLKEKFNWVDFNPELTDPVSFRGQTFTNPRSPQMPFHQLAIALCRNNFSLPTLAILDEKMNLLDAIALYLNPKVMKDITTYYGDNIYKTKSWQDYMKPDGK